MAKWIPAWRYVPIDYNQELGALENVTQKCVFINNIGGQQLRLRFNNLYSDESMRIDRAAIALHDRQTGVTSPSRSVTLRGSTTICIPAGTQPYSDVLDMPITPQQDILVSLYFGHRTVLRSVCTTATGFGWQSTQLTGDFGLTDALGYTVREQLVPPLAHEPYPVQFAAGICEVSVLAEEDVRLIALFGDSITHMSYFMDSFQAELYARFPGKAAVINGGISGNRIQKSHPLSPDFPGSGNQFGIAGRDRFRRDVYDGCRPDIVFVMEGVNDCSHSLCFSEPTVPTAEDVFAALTDVVRQAKAQESRVYISTISPFGAFGDSWRPQAEALRCQYNALIRACSIADGIVDMDAVLRDPTDIHRMQEGLHLGDGVHPNWHGGRRMADALLAALF